MENNSLAIPSKASQRKDKEMSFAENVGINWDNYRINRLKVPYHRFTTDRDRWINRIVGIALNNPSSRVPELVEFYFEEGGAAAFSYWRGLSNNGRKRFYRDLSKKIIEALSEKV